MSGADKTGFESCQLSRPEGRSLEQSQLGWQGKRPVTRFCAPTQIGLFVDQDSIVERRSGNEALRSASAGIFLPGIHGGFPRNEVNPIPRGKPGMVLSPEPQGVGTHARKKRRRLWPYILVGIVLVVLFWFPFYWVIVTSLNSANQVLQFPPVFLPHWQWQNYVQAWRMAPWMRYFLNTLFIATATTLLVLLTSLMAAFAFGTMEFSGKTVIFAGFLALMMVPQTVLLIPDYIVLRDIHWLNTYWAQIVPWGASVFGIFLLRQFFLSFPRELMDAADLDGASRWRFLWQIALPMARPVLITIGLYAFLGSWDSFLWPYIMTSSPSVQPIEVGLANFLGTNGTDWTGLSASVVFTTLPVMVLFLVAQKQFLSGAYATTGGIK